jgi:anti-anti-sigma factor
MPERIKVPARFVVATLEDFRRAVDDRVAVADLMNGGAVDVVLDFSGTIYLDSAALGLLYTWKRDLFARRATLRLEGLSPDIRELFRLTNLTTLFPEAAEPSDEG